MKPHEFNQRRIEKGEKIHRAFVCDNIKSINEDKRLIDFVISTEDKDRYGDIILCKGWKLQAYKKNPIVLFGHQSRVPPIGRSVKVWKTETNLNATAEFMPREMSPFADSIYQMYVGGFLKAVSVGFMPISWEIMYDDDDYFDGIKFLKQELLEFSAVPIPANSEALIDAKSKGIDVDPFSDWAESVLDNWDSQGTFIEDLYSVNKKQIELIKRKASGKELYRVPKKKQEQLLERNLKYAEEARNRKETAEMGNLLKGASASLNRKSVAFANSCINKGEVNLEDDLETDAANFDPEDCLGVTKDNDIESYHLPYINEGVVYRSSLVKIKRMAAEKGNCDLFNTSKRLLDRIDKDGDVDIEKALSLLEKFDVSDEDCESLIITAFDSGGVRSVFFDNMPEKVMISKDLVINKIEGDALSLRGNDDNFVVELSGANGLLEYYPYGCNKDGDMVCFLSNKPDIVDFSKEKDTVLIDEVKSDIEEGANDEVDDDEVDDEVDDRNDKEVESSIEVVTVLEYTLVDLEEALDKCKETNILSDKRTFRKLEYLAGYMKELAIRIDPDSDNKVKDKSDIKSDFDEGDIRTDEVDKYIDGVLGPKVTKIVESVFNKAKGRLD